MRDSITTPHVLLRARTEALLRERWGADLRLPELRLIKDATRTLVLSGRLEGERAPCEAVIVKVIRDDEATGFTEWASLAFLDELPAARGAVPRFLGGDAAGRLVVMEELAPGRTLHELLERGTRAEAETALHRLAQQTARLPVAALGGEERFWEIRAALPAAGEIDHRREAEGWLAARPRRAEWLDAAGCVVPKGFETAQELVAATYADPGPWLSFTHGDPAPSNVHLAADTLALIDFEYGAFRHALYDITAWDTLCPLPRRSVAAMRQWFQAALARALPTARGDAAFALAWATMCAYRGLAILSWVAPAVLEADRPWVGEWTARRAVLAAAERTAEATHDTTELAPIAEATAALTHALRRRWPELGGGELTPPWPALAADA
jgi:hypothetical protein